MSTVTLAQIFDIVNGPIDYINTNISLGQCIKTSLQKISDAINYTSSPFLVDMVYDASGDAIQDSSLVDLTTSMITQTDTFLSACTTALQTARVQQASTTASYDFLTSTFADAQETFINEYTNYLTAYQFLFTMVKQPSWKSGYESVVTSAMQITVTLVNDDFRPQFSTKWMSSAQLRVVRRVLSYLTDCFQTLVVIVAPIDAKYNGNSTLSSSVIGTITNAFSTVMTQFSTLHTEGSDFVDQVDDWESIARSTDANIDLIQAPISSTLTTFIDNVGNSKSGTITTLSIDTAGSGYAVGDIITITAPTDGTDAVIVVKTTADVDGGDSGTVTSVEIVEGGAGFDTDSDLSTLGITSTTGSGSGIDITVSAVGTITSLLGTVSSMNDSLAGV